MNSCRLCEHSEAIQKRALIECVTKNKNMHVFYSIREIDCFAMLAKMNWEYNSYIRPQGDAEAEWTLRRLAERSRPFPTNRWWRVVQYHIKDKQNFAATKAAQRRGKRCRR